VNLFDFIKAELVEEEQEEVRLSIVGVIAVLLTREGAESRLMRSLRVERKGGVSERKRESSFVCSFHSYALYVVESTIYCLRTESERTGKSTRQLRLDSISSIERVRSKGSFV